MANSSGKILGRTEAFLGCLMAIFVWEDVPGPCKDLCLFCFGSVSFLIHLRSWRSHLLPGYLQCLLPKAPTMRSMLKKWTRWFEELLLQVIQVEKKDEEEEGRGRSGSCWKNSLWFLGREVDRYKNPTIFLLHLHIHFPLSPFFNHIPRRRSWKNRNQEQEKD